MADGNDSPKRGSGLAGADSGAGEKLVSDVSLEEANSMLTYVQAISTSFRGFDDDEIGILSENLSIMKFDTDEALVERGEEGTWFGVLLSGSLMIVLPDGGKIELPAGNIIGEMVIWTQGSKRSASMKGGEPGMVATMLTTDLARFASDHPACGMKLMKLMGKSALSKNMDNMRRQRSGQITPALKWTAGKGAPKKAAGADEMSSALSELLLDYDFDMTEANTLSEASELTQFKAGQVLVEAGQTWPYVMIVVKGTLCVEHVGAPRAARLGSGSG